MRSDAMDNTTTERPRDRGVRASLSADVHIGVDRHTRSRICVTSRASLGFRAVRAFDLSGREFSNSGVTCLVRRIEATLLTVCFRKRTRQLIGETYKNFRQYIFLLIIVASYSRLRHHRNSMAPAQDHQRRPDNE